MTLTVLATTGGHTASKVWSLGADGRPTLRGFDAGYAFLFAPLTVTSIQQLAEVLELLARRDDCLVVRGVPVEDLDLSTPHYRRSRARPGEPATLREAPGGLPWAMLDFDALQLPFPLDVHDPERAVRHVLGLLPASFAGVSTYWQLGSKAGMTDPHALSLHLWVWLDRALTDRELDTWADSFGVEVDRTLFRTVQPHYVCAPRFDGLDDPLPRRSGLLLGERDAVHVPAIPARPKRAFAPLRGGVAHYETTIKHLGDGPGRGGFYRPILQAVWDYVASGRSDFDWLKADVREQATRAPGADARSSDYLERLTSDEELDRFIEGALEKTAPPRAATRESLGRVAKRLKRSRDLRNQDLGEVLERALRGEPIEGGAAALDALIREIADPDVDPGSIARVLAEALQVTPGAPTVEAVALAAERVQAASRDAAIEAAIKSDDEHRVRIREAFGGSRGYPYTGEELASWEAEGALVHRWIIQHRKQFYVFFAGKYQGPITSEELLTHGLTFLAPAISAGVDVVGKTSAEMMEAYGGPAMQVEASLCEPWTRFDPTTHTITEAACPLVDLAPAYDADVDAWLRLLAGPKIEALLDWLAVVTELSRPCPALFLHGASGAGKSLLAYGLARLWGGDTRPTDLESAMGDFNSALIDCPLVLGDERIPKDNRGVPRTEELREFVSRTSQPLRRKYLAETTLRGATRTVITTNNLHLLAIPGELTNQDIEAIGERFLYLPVSGEASAWLLDRGGMDFASTFVTEARIARHALWLRETRPRPAGGRWAVPGDCAELLRAMRTGTGLRWPICHWITSWIMDPSDIHAGDAVRSLEGRVYVNSTRLRRDWATYLGDERVPTLQSIQRALAELCVPGEEGRKCLGSREARVWMREVDVGNLLAWAGAHDGPPEAEILEGIGRAEARAAARNFSGGFGKSN